jgi:transposase
MAYREVSWMDVDEVLRRTRAGESQRQIARALGLARDTVAAYLRDARNAATTEARPRRSPGPEPGHAPEMQRLQPYQAQIATWLQQDRLQLTRIQELLAQQGLPVAYTTLRRFGRWAGLARSRPTTVRMARTAPGEVAEMDFAKLGPLLNPLTGKRQVVWGLSVVLVYSRHSFLWSVVQQTVDATVEGLEAAWRFFQGVPQRLVLDNFPAAVAGTDPLAPKPTRAFLEYSQARGFLLDPARVRHPQDKPHVERGIQYARERFWKGGSFADLADARQQAERWCRAVAGQRVHGTTRQLPIVVFTDQEQAHLQPYDGVPYDVPVWREVTVHPDHHVSFPYALYSVPSTTCPPGTKLEVRGDRAVVKLYRRGDLVKVHPRQLAGGRSTDPADYPQERTAYALRAPEQLVRQAQALGPSIGSFAERLLSGPLPWRKLRQGQKLLRLTDRYSAERLEAACARALGFDLLDVRRVERILVLALEAESQPVPPPDERVRALPASRFVRPGSAFDHRFTAQDGAAASEEGAR